ncbi:uncharacterized protein LOC124951650 [Vespa velutina]|uniref:uncharacterized protein LOC124951650 n=1 Tax=Vespa velutina TaxID=202808 RepID=UPI001FB3A36F|nr:uncharacterized protein LOC124951650 [Vespa velutina]
MTLPFIFIIFWMFGMIWVRKDPCISSIYNNLTLQLIYLYIQGAYHWYKDNESTRIASSRKPNFKQKLKNRKSTTSIESVDMSENEDFPKCVKRKIRQENKTRWPSRTSINE